MGWVDGSGTWSTGTNKDTLPRASLFTTIPDYSRRVRGYTLVTLGATTLFYYSVVHEEVGSMVDGGQSGEKARLPPRDSLLAFVEIRVVQLHQIGRLTISQSALRNSARGVARLRNDPVTAGSCLNVDVFLCACKRSVWKTFSGSRSSRIL